MKTTKKMLCFIMAIAVMMGSMGLVSAFADNGTTETAGTTKNAVTAPTAELTGDPQYFIKYTSEVLNTTKMLSNNEMNQLLDASQDITRDGEYVKSAAKSGAKVTGKSNGSISLTKDSVEDGDSYQYAANLEIPLTDEMRANYLKADNNTLYLSYYLTKANIASGSNTGCFTDCQIRIYTKFKDNFTETINGKDFTRKLKLTSLGVATNVCYQQNINKAIQFLGTDNKPLENLESVESIIISIYNYSKNVEAAIEMSGITYAGVPGITAYEEPQPAAKDEYITLTDWSKHYLNGYADTPSSVKYYSEGGYESKNYKSLNQSGWYYYKNMTAVTSKQLNTVFSLDRNALNKAIVTANQPGGTGKLKITCKFPVIKDTDGNNMMGEFQVVFERLDGQASLTPVQTWINPDQEYTFDLDVSSLKVNSVSKVRIALMAFWKYDPAGNVFYDTDTAKKYDKDGNLLKAVTNEAGDFLGYDNGKGGALLQEGDVAKITAKCSDGRQDVDITSIVSRLTLRTMKDVEAFVSPIYTGAIDGATTTVTTAANNSSTTASTDYKYAGYHFYDFTPQAYAETYGWASHASFVNYFQDGYYDSYEVVDKNFDTDNMKQGYKDPANPSKKVTYDTQYAKDYEEAKSLVSGGYQFELSSPYPRTQNQHQSYFHYSGKSEDARLTDPNVGDHKNQKAQGETYDFTEQMKLGLKYAKENPDPEKAGYLAIDVYAVSAVHGYKNTYNATYKAWCQKNNKTCANESTPIQMLVTIFASRDGESISTTAMEMIPSGQKKTLYIDISEIEVEDITGISVAAQNYSLLANKEQGGDNQVVGITDVKARYSAIYVPGNKNTDLTTTVNVTRPLNLTEAKKLKKLYDALPGLTVDDYNTKADYNKLARFIKAWSKASEATQKYCEENYGIDYSLIGMLEQDVYDKIFGSGAGGAGGAGGSGSEFGDDSDSGTSPETGDVAFPMMSLLVAGVSGYLILRTKKKK